MSINAFEDEVFAEACEGILDYFRDKDSVPVRVIDRRPDPVSDRIAMACLVEVVTSRPEEYGGPFGEAVLRIANAEVI